MKLEELLRNYILQIIKEEKDKEEDLLGEPDLSKEDEREEDEDCGGTHDEQSVSANVAGYTLPLGASNKPSTLKQRGDIAGSGFGGAKPIKKKKKKKKKSAGKDWYK